MKKSNFQKSSNDKPNQSFGIRLGNYDFTQKEMHKAICADCKKECEVPFKPKNDKPVYCRDCFSKHKPKRF